MPKDKMIPCLIHIPCTLPDGSEVDLEPLLEILDRQFGGSSNLGVISGRWVAPEGVVIAESMLRIEVSVKDKELWRLHDTAKDIGERTRQKAIYVVENFGAQTQLIWMDGEDESETSATGTQ